MITSASQDFNADIEVFDLSLEISDGVTSTQRRGIVKTSPLAERRRTEGGE